MRYWSAQNCFTPREHRLVHFGPEAVPDRPQYRSEVRDSREESPRGRTNPRREVEQKKRERAEDAKAREQLSVVEDQKTLRKIEAEIDSSDDTKAIKGFGDLGLERWGYRSDTKEGPFAPQSAEWRKQHMAQSANGSLMMGVAHVDFSQPSQPTGGENSERANAEMLLNKYVKPEVVNAAKQALAAGKRVVFLAEGKSGGEENTEQRIIAAALDKQFPGQIIQSTWDNKAVNVFTVNRKGEHQGIDTKSPVVQKLAAKYARPGYEGSVVVEAGLWAMMHGEGEELNLSDKAAEFLREECSIEVDLSKSEKTGEEKDKEQQQVKDILKSAAFKGDGVLADMTNDYNRLRQENMLQMVSAIENDKQGGIAIVTPGASHAYSMKKVIGSDVLPLNDRSGNSR